VWNNVKAKFRRPLDSLILEEGFIESLIGDANEFLDTEGKHCSILTSLRHLNLFGIWKIGMLNPESRTAEGICYMALLARERVRIVYPFGKYLK
jgi:hypothetical protein